MNEREFRELAAAYALGALDAAERETVERALSENPEWASLLAEDIDTVAALADTFEPEEPRPEVRDALFAELDARIAGGMPPSALRDSDSRKEPAGPRSHDVPSTRPARATPDGFSDPDDEDPPVRRRPGLRLLALVAIAAMVLGLGSGVIALVLQPAPPEQVGALEQISGAPDSRTASAPVTGGGEAALTWSLTQGAAMLMTEGLASAPSGHTYEVWVVRGEEKIPAGTFDPDAEGTAAVLMRGEMHSGDVIAVTIEPTGGAPEGIPTTDPVFAISTAGGTEG